MEKQPVRVLPARAWRTYRGGSLIAALHGEAGEDSHFPEEWLLSTVQARNPGREQIQEGLSMLPDGRTLREYIAADPEGLLGPGRRETGMLMKLIDAAERLSVQAHPTRADAMRFFQSPFGKTECWHILGGRSVDGQPPCIYFGFKAGVTREEWARLFYAQNIPGMLNCLHRLEVQPGETYLIHGGVPHAIGAGCFLAEIQEPTDLTLRVERFSPAGEPLPDQSCHQGAGFEAMLDCFDYDGCDLAEARRRWMLPPRTLSAQPGQYLRQALVDYADTPYFRMEKLRVEGALEQAGENQFHGLYVLSGAGEMRFAGKSQRLTPGDQYFVPAGACYSLHCTGDPLALLRYEGPQAT